MAHRAPTVLPYENTVGHRSRGYETIQMDRPVEADIRTIARMSAVPTILQIISETTNLRFAAVARVTESSWTACAVLDRIDFGLRVGGSLDVTTTLCSEIRSSRDPIIIERASRDTVYCNHPTPRMYGFESYIAVPIIRRSGEVFGTICALDPLPAKLLDGKIPSMVKLYADLIAAQLEVEEQLEESRAALEIAAETAALREQFIAVLGHDLRNPLFSVDAGVRLLSKAPRDERETLILSQMRQSSARMSELIDNILDFARGRLGGGIPIERRMVPDLGSILGRIVSELRIVPPGPADRRHDGIPWLRSTAIRTGSRNCSPTSSPMPWLTARPADASRSRPASRTGNCWWR